MVLGIGNQVVPLVGSEFAGWISAALLVVGGPTLVALMLADSFQRRFRVFVNTHPYKNKYDYRKEWLSLAERLSRAISIEEIVSGIVERLLESMSVKKAGVFLLEEGQVGLRLAFGRGFGADEQVLKADRAFLEYILEHVEPIDIERVKFSLFARANMEMVDELRRIDIRIAAPMVVRDEVLGLLVIGPELSDQPFRPDDYDLCRAVAAQAATVIMMSRLAEELAQGSEIRAFAEMASFMVHDIKNCVNILSLVAANAESHIHEPAFQLEMIRAVDISVQKMQELLTRLSGVRQPSLRREHVDLGRVVQDALRSLAAGIPAGVRIETFVDSAVSVYADREQLEGVIRNLLMNALEALDKIGEVRIEARRNCDEAVLVVSDTGHGMSAEFMNRLLFRPFRSSKGGLGIGLYQCKQVAEAHGGRLEVHSVEGRGTTCTLILPVDGGGEVLATVDGTLVAG